MLLLEREGPLALLSAAFDHAATGSGSSVLIGGEAGIGKTTLVEAFTRPRSDRRARVLWGACEALLTPRPLGPLIDMAEAQGGEMRVALRARRPPHELFQLFLNELRDPRDP